MLRTLTLNNLSRRVGKGSTVVGCNAQQGKTPAGVDWHAKRVDSCGCESVCNEEIIQWVLTGMQ
jgi:hypothetical protein